MNAPVTIAGGEPVLSLEAVQLELALQFHDATDRDFEASVRDGLEAVGGLFLFEMRADAFADCQRVAAASVGQGEDRLLVLVILPSDGGPMRVEPASASSSPLAGFAASYAGLVERFDRF